VGGILGGFAGAIAVLRRIVPQLRFGKIPPIILGYGHDRQRPCLQVE
jgi:hypothetical protein